MVTLRLAFFGTPAFAVPTLERLIRSAHDVAAVVTQPDRPRGRGLQLTESPVKRLAAAKGLPVFQPARLRDEAFLRDLIDWHADLGIVAAYGKILPDEVLRGFRLGLLNVHASLLPRYRGAAPVHRAIIAGEPETGISIMRVVKELDAGPVLQMARRPIGPDETSEEVERDLARLGAELLLATVVELLEGRARQVPQDDRQATYAPRLTKQDGLIDWRAPAPAVHNLVRGLHPWPLAFTYTDGARYVIRRTALDRGTAREGAPGAILEAHGDTLRVAAGGGTSLRIVEIQPEGRRPMRSRDFLAGHHLQPGSRFGPS